MTQSLFLQAFEGTNEKIPVWFMRQAGRYLPQYRALKEKHSLETMFHTPELAAEITCMPIDILNVDAAILFADILTLPAQMGFNVKFDDKKGPQIERFESLNNVHDFADLFYITETISIVNQKLPEHIPLIGFAGSPFTVLTYLIEGGSSTLFRKTFKFIQENTKLFHEYMDFLTINTIDYLNLQAKAGIKAFQLFDSWAGILRPLDYEHLVLPYIQRILKEINLPSIYFARNCRHLLSLMSESNANFLSVCHTVKLGNTPELSDSDIGIQGNLFNGLLYADYPKIEEELNCTLKGAQHYQRYIFNLSHGVFQDTDVDKLKFVVEKVHAFDWGHLKCLKT